MKQFKDLEEKFVSSEHIFSGKLLNVYRDVVTLPNGSDTTREYIKHLGAVAIVPVTDDGKVIIERQFRYPLGAVITEIPAGKRDSKEEDHLEAAKRELREETGYTADEWIEMGDYHPAAAYSDEMIRLYLAKGLHETGQELDDDEFLNIEAVPLNQLVDEVMKGQITDGKTQTALLKAAIKLKQN